MKPVKVVFNEATDGGHHVTLEDEHGETFQLDLPAGAPVTMFLEATWESSQSSTANSAE